MEVQGSDIFQQVAAGDERAFEQLFNQHWEQVYGTSFRLTKSHEQSLDLAQEIFIRIWENRHKLADVKNEKGYIYTLSRNVVLDFLRKKVFSDDNIGLLVQYFADHSADAQKQMEFRELQNALQSAIEHLPEKIKEVFLLSRHEGLTHEEIATTLGISVTSSKTYIVRALREIRRFLDTYSDNTTILLAAWVIVNSIKNN